MSSAFDLNEEYLTVAEAARLLKVSQSTIWRWINRGDLPAYRIGQRGIRVRAGELGKLVRPARREQGASVGKVERFHLPPLSANERAQMLAAVADARSMQAAMLKAHGGKPFSSSAEILDVLRRQRSDELP